MHKILNCTSPREQYISDAAVVWCYDHRFDAAFCKLLERIGVFYSDPIRIAGGAKFLAFPEDASERQFILEQIRTSMRLHSTRTVVLMLHSDCGAYGGLAAFNNDAGKEAQSHCADLKRAAAFLESTIPELTVKAFYVDFDGVWEVELAQSIEIARGAVPAGITAKS